MGQFTARDPAARSPSRSQGMTHQCAGDTGLSFVDFWVESPFSAGSLMLFLMRLVLGELSVIQYMWLYFSFPSIFTFMIFPAHPL